jgi:hypothetical protein
LLIGFELGIAEGWEDGSIVDGLEDGLWLGVELDIAKGSEVSALS